MKKTNNTAFLEAMEEAKKNRKRYEEAKAKSKASLPKLKLDTPYPTTVLSVETKENYSFIRIRVWCNHKGIDREVKINLDTQEFRYDEICESAGVEELAEMIGRHYDTQYVKNKGFKNWEVLGELDESDLLEYLEEMQKEYEKKNARPKNRKKSINLLSDDSEEEESEDDPDYAEEDDDPDFEEDDELEEFEELLNSDD